MIKHSNYKMFIDDERFPESPDWLIVRNSMECVLAVEYYGFPKEISFDHDLGYVNGKAHTVMEFLRWVQNKCEDGELIFPHDFKFVVHSQNPVGAKNIQGLVEKLCEHFQE